MTGLKTHGHKGEEPPYNFHVDDVVVYHPVGTSSNTAVGIIRDILQEPDIVREGRPVTVRASEEGPRFLIENMHTKKETPYKRSSILRLATEQDLEEQKAKGNISGDIHEYLQEEEGEKEEQKGKLEFMFHGKQEHKLHTAA